MDHTPFHSSLRTKNQQRITDYLLTRTHFIMDLQTIRTTATALAREAGAVLMSKFDQPHQQHTKQSITDIVTEGDTASEAIILSGLRHHFPTHRIVSEEGGGDSSASAETADYIWYVDPLD